LQRFKSLNINILKVIIMKQICKTVALRTRTMKNGMLSFYLDYYPGFRDHLSMKTIRHETIGIYIYENPRNNREKEYNK
jgi:hypothetical protein